MLRIGLLHWSIGTSDPVKVLTWMRASNSHLSEWRLLLSPCLFILGNSLLDYHFLCRLLTGYSKPKDSWSIDLPPLSEGVVNGLLLWVLWQTVRTGDVTTALNPYSNVYGWLRTARKWWLEVFLPDVPTVFGWGWVGTSKHNYRRIVFIG